MKRKLPFYMAYPTPFLFDEEREERIERRDFEYMESLYPAEAKKLLPYIEEEGDRLEYEGSVIFDEYPDRLQLRLAAGRVYDRVKGRRDMEADRESLRILIEVMLYHELYRRRAGQRRKRQRPPLGLS